MSERSDEHIEPPPYDVRMRGGPCHGAVVTIRRGQQSVTVPMPMNHNQFLAGMGCEPIESIETSYVYLRKDLGYGYAGDRQIDGYRKPRHFEIWVEESTTSDQLQILMKGHPRR